MHCLYEVKSGGASIPRITNDRHIKWPIVEFTNARSIIWSKKIFMIIRKKVSNLCFHPKQHLIEFHVHPKHHLIEFHVHPKRQSSESSKSLLSNKKKGLKIRWVVQEILASKVFKSTYDKIHPIPSHPTHF